MIKIAVKVITTIAIAITINLFFEVNHAKSDSPLTSTELVVGYEDLPIIIKLKKNKMMDQQVLYFLLGNAPLDQKAAVINALGWNFNGQNNADLFIQGLLERERIRTINQLKLRDLTAEDKFVLGYLLAMDDYFNLSPLEANSRQAVLSATPLELLSQAAFALPDDFTVHFVKSLIEAQLYFSNSWCAIYLSPTEVLQRFPPNRRNLNPLAVTKAMEYINLYRDNCFGFE